MGVAMKSKKKWQVWHFISLTADFLSNVCLMLFNSDLLINGLKMGELGRMENMMEGF